MKNGAAGSPAWAWDPTLYAGSARFYAVGRVSYPAELAEALVTPLGLDGTGDLLDVSCGIDTEAELPGPRPPRAEITELVGRYLGPGRRAGQGVLSAGTADGEDTVYRAAGFAGPQRLELPGRVVTRTEDEVAASVYSLSSAAPHLFGDRLPRFDAELRRLLAATSADGRFSEQMRSIAVDIWR